MTRQWYSSVRVAEEHNAYKTIVEKETGRLLGAHVIGAGAEEQLNLFTLAMKGGLKARDLKSVMFAYPSYASDLAYMV